MMLAEAANISCDMVTKIENGASGARFPVIERIAEALDIDPAELFTTELRNGSIRRGAFDELTVRLAALSEADLIKLIHVLEIMTTFGRG